MRTLRNNRVKIGVAALVVAIIAFIGLFVRAYNNDSTSAAPTFGPPTSTIDIPSASSSASAKPKPSTKPSGDLANYTFPNGVRYTGGDTAFFRFQNQHTVLLRVFSSGNVQLIRVGWLAPESYDAPYGDMRNLASPWSLTLHSSGDKYHAALFVGTARENNPPAVTCEIYIDGKLVDRKTAQYYGSRQVCVG